MIITESVVNLSVSQTELDFILGKKRTAFQLFKIVLVGNRKDNTNGIILNYRKQWLSAGRHIIARGQAHFADNAGYRRIYFGIVKIDFGQVIIGTGLSYGSLSTQIFGLGIVKFGFRHRFRADLFYPFIIDLGIGKICPGLQNLRFGGIDLRLVFSLFNH